VNIAHGGARGPDDQPLEADEEAEKLLAKAEADGDGRQVQPMSGPAVVAREAAPAIVAYAEQNGANHIVMGTGDKRGVQRLVLGSVASRSGGQATLHGYGCPLAGAASFSCKGCESDPGPASASGVQMFTDRKKI
jgi:hypothetical protein